MSEQVGGIGANLKKALFGATLIYGIAVAYTLVIVIIAQFFATIFPNTTNVFQMIWNGTRSLALFFLLLPFALGLIGGAFVIDVATAFFFPILHALNPQLFIWETGTNFVLPASEIVETLQSLVETIFPPL